MRSFALLLSALVGTCMSTTAAVHPKDLLNRASRSASRLEKRQTGEAFEDPVLNERVERFRYPATEKYYVNGTSLPQVDFDIGESYAGLIPISDDPDETRELFFWFFPSNNPEAANEITVWMNGGPGCSSLSGMIGSIGPFAWLPGTAQPVKNAYPWTNLTNVVFIEYPIGVGFTQGQSNVDNQVDAAQQFIGFWRNFATDFCLENFKVYLSGESYGGFYVPYIADAFIERADPVFFNLHGIFLISPIFGDQTNHAQTVTTHYVRYWNRILGLNDTFVEEMNAYSEACGYEAYYDEYFQFPAPQRAFPVLDNPYLDAPRYTCDIFDLVAWAIWELNPCFNYYRISDQCPFPWSVLGKINVADTIPTDYTSYFDNPALQLAIHVPPTNWEQCRIGAFRDPLTGEAVSDTSPPPANNGVLQRVIEHTQNVLVGTGDLDYLLPTNGTLLALQNTTWAGRRGLQEYPGKQFYVPYHPQGNPESVSGAGVVGTWTTERGLTFFRLGLAGHQIPQHAPGATYRAMEVLLGRVGSLSDSAPFTTLPGDWTGEFSLPTTKED